MELKLKFCLFIYYFELSIITKKIFKEKMDIFELSNKHTLIILEVIFLGSFQRCYISKRQHDRGV